MSNDNMFEVVAEATYDPATDTLEVVSTAEDAEVFSWVMGSSGTMWSWWLDVEYHGGSWDDPSDITFEIEDPESDVRSIVKRVTPRQIVEAFHTAVRTVPSMREMTYEDLDAGSADCVLQIAVLGDVVYG